MKTWPDQNMLASWRPWPDPADAKPTPQHPLSPRDAYRTQAEARQFHRRVFPPHTKFYAAPGLRFPPSDDSPLFPTSPNDTRQQITPFPSDRPTPVKHSQNGKERVSFLVPVLRLLLGENWTGAGHEGEGGKRRRGEGGEGAGGKCGSGGSITKSDGYDDGTASLRRKLPNLSLRKPLDPFPTEASPPEPPELQIRHRL